MMKRNFLITMILCLTSIVVFAQEKPLRSYQVSFIYPIGTAGDKSMDYVNRNSVNLLAGVNGGVDGFEFGSILNLNNGNVRGFQFSGVANITSGNAVGFTFAGCQNLTLGSFKGFTFAGVSNVIIGDVKGLAFSGVINYTNKNLHGFQAAGVANIADSVSGLQTAVTNVSTKTLSGLQLGVVNVAHQLGSKDKRTNGLQIGIINVTDTVASGVPIGLFNFVKHGYYAVELSANEVLYGNASFKFGTKKFYTILGAGYSTFNNKHSWSGNMGFGHISKLADKHNVCVEVLSSYIAYDNVFKDNLNTLGTLKLNYQYEFTDKLSIFGGATFNTYVTNQKVNGQYGTLNVPYTLYKHEGDKVSVSNWVGVNAGIILKL